DVECGAHPHLSGWLVQALHDREMCLNPGFQRHVEWNCQELCRLPHADPMSLEGKNSEGSVWLPETLQSLEYIQSTYDRLRGDVQPRFGVRTYCPLVESPFRCL